MNCTNCGNIINPGDNVCGNCGAPVNYSSNNMNSQYGGVYNQPSPMPNYDPTMDYTPISMWGYFGYQLLFALPCIGFICLLIFSFGGTKNINLRNFARSYFCFLIIAVVFVLFMMAIAGAGIFAASSSF